MLLERNEEIMYFTGIVGGQLHRLHFQFGVMVGTNQVLLTKPIDQLGLILMRAFS